MNKTWYIIACQIAVILTSCIRPDKPLDNSTEAVQPKIFTFPIDNENVSKFGFIEMDNGISIGVTSVCIVNNYVYLTDEFHKNIKRLDVSTSTLICSYEITDSTFFKQFNDVIDFNGNLYITSSERNVYVINYDLDRSSFFTIPTIGGYPIGIMSKTDSTIDFCVMVRDSLYRVNHNNEVVLKRQLENSEILKLTNYFNVELGNIRSKRLNYYKNENGEYMEINGRSVKLVNPFTYASDAFNVDFDNNYLVIFNCNSKELKLYIYPLG